MTSKTKKTKLTNVITKQPAKAIGYIRVSTQEQGKDGVSLEAQRELIEKYVKNKGMECLIFSDVQSGKSLDKRQGLQNALDAMNDGDVLVVYSLSRMSRSTQDTFNIVNPLKERGCDIVSLKENVDTTSAAGKLFFTMLTGFNEFERNITSERTKTALDYVRSNGKHVGGIPYGKMVVDSKLVDNLDEQKPLADILRLRRRGFSLPAIAAKLTEQGYKPRRGNTWNAGTIKRIVNQNGIH